MKTGRDYKFWFCTGSQDLYGDECLRKVAEHSKIIVEELNKSGVLPFEVVWKPAFWVIQHKFLRFFKKKKYSMYELKIVRDYKEGKVTKEQLDKCSTCDMCATINDGLSAASKEQLVGKTGEEIVDADIAKQMEK